MNVTPHPPDSKLTFEFPLNERFRVFLRIEKLLHRWQRYARPSCADDHHTAVLTLLDIYDFVFRNDVKGDLLSDLARYKTALGQYFNFPNVSEEKLNQAILRLVDACKQIEQSPKFGGNLGDNEWLINIKSRLAVSSSVCSFDMGFYYQWLGGSEASRLNDLQAWFQPFMPMFDAVSLLLELARNLAFEKACETNNHAYQIPLSGRKFDLMRVCFAADSELLPDFSANKHVIWLRFAVPAVSNLRANRQFAINYEARDEIQFDLALSGVPATQSVHKTRESHSHTFYGFL